MTNLSELFPGFESEIPADGFNGVLLDVVNPLGVTDGAFIPKNDGSLLVADSNLILGGSAGALADGYWQPLNPWNTFINIQSGAPAWTGLGRLYEMHGKFDAASPVTNSGVRIIFNLATAWTDYWNFQLEWNGSQFYAHLDEVAAGSGYLRDTILLGNITTPRTWSMKVWDYGDYVRCSITMFDINGGSQNEDTLYYYTSGRPAKSATPMYFTGIGSVDVWGIRSARITDL